MTVSKIPLVAVIGHPISHSKSPRLHGNWLKKLGLQGHYIPVDVEPADFGYVLKAMPKMGFVGANVTVPHKNLALMYADHVSDRAALIGAANTLSFSDDGKIYADNTDGYGFIENIKDHQPDWNAASGPALVLGAGGASRAVLSALIEAGVPEIYLANRTRARADQLKTDLGARIQVLDWSKVSNILDGIDLMVNTTSLGMVGKPDLSLNLKNLTAKTLVTDLVYTPLETDLLKQASAIGCPVVDGLGMLIHQAVPGFERWFGKKPTVDQETRNLLLS